MIDIDPNLLYASSVVGASILARHHTLIRELRTSNDSLIARIATASDRIAELTLALSKLCEEREGLRSEREELRAELRQARADLAKLLEQQQQKGSQS